MESVASYAWMILVGAGGAIIGGSIANLFSRNGEGPLTHPIGLVFCGIGAMVALLAWKGATSLLRSERPVIPS